MKGPAPFIIRPDNPTLAARGRHAALKSDEIAPLAAPVSVAHARQFFQPSPWKRVKAAKAVIFR